MHYGKYIKLTGGKSMGFTDSFRRQHGELLHIAKQMSELFNAEELTKDASAIRGLLSTLAGKLNVHLTMEDNSFYPTLLNGKDEEKKQIAQKYIDEMGQIKVVFGEYLKKWPTAKVIQSNPEEFIKETKGIFEALAKRIDKEDNELFPLVDK